eukprot:1141494-Pelagomonas_calceolata.AAC.2
MHMQFTLLIQCLHICHTVLGSYGTWIFPITFFATLPDSGCGFTLVKLNRLFGPIAFLQSVIPVTLMTFKVKHMCCSGVPIPKSALSVRIMPLFSSTTSLFYIHISHRIPAVPNFLLQRNKKLFYFMSELLDLLLAGMVKPQADQPNRLAGGLPV